MNLQVSRNDSSGSKSPHVDDVLDANQRPHQTSMPRHDSIEGTDDAHDVDDAHSSELADPNDASGELSQGRTRSMRNRPTGLGRAAVSILE